MNTYNSIRVWSLKEQYVSPLYFHYYIKQTWRYVNEYENKENKNGIDEMDSSPNEFSRIENETCKQPI